MRDEKGAGIVLGYLLIVIEAVTGIVLTVVLINNLGQSGYGLYKLAASWVSLVSVLDFGLGGTITRYTIKYRTNSDIQSERKFIGIAFAVYFVLSLAVLVIGIIISFFLPLFVSELSNSQLTELRIVFMLLIGKTCITLFNHAFSGRFIAIERFVYIKTSTIFSCLARLLLIIVVVPAIPSPITVAAIDFILICVQLLCNIIANRMFGFEKIKFFGWDKSLFSELFAFTFSIFIASVINQFNSNVDNIVLGAFTTTAVVGLYASIMQIYTIYSTLSTAIQGVFLAQVSKNVFQNKSDDEITKSIILPSRMQVVVLLFALTGFIHFGDEFLYIWIGNTYSSLQLKEAYIVGIIIMVSATWQLFQNSATNVLKAKNLLRGKVMITAASTIVNFLLTILLVPKYGMLGAAIGTAISMVGGYGIATNIYYSRIVKINLKLYYSKTFSKLWYAIPTVFAFGFLIDNVFVGGIKTFLLKCIIYSFLYFAVILLLGLNTNEKSFIFNKMLKGTVAKTRL